MFKVIIFIGLVSLISCGRCKKEKDVNSQKTNVTSEIFVVDKDSAICAKKERSYNGSLFMSRNVDSVEILCLFFGEYGEKSFNIFLSNTNYTLVNTYNKREVLKAGFENNKSQLIEYINQFFIEKNTKATLKKRKRKYIRSMDYPRIKVVGYQDKKEVFNETIQIGDEKYDIEYSTMFLEFYEFLDCLVRNK